MGARRGAVIARLLTPESDKLYPIPEEVGMTHGPEEDIFLDSSLLSGNTMSERSYELETG